MPPQLADNDNSHDLRAWMATIPSFAADWPRGIISSARAATTPAAPPAPGLSAGGLSFSRDPHRAGRFDFCSFHGGPYA